MVTTLDEAGGTEMNEPRKRPAARAADRAGANAEAVARMTGAEPVLIDVQPAGDVIPGMTPNMILTSGPPLPWPEYYGGHPVYYHHDNWYYRDNRGWNYYRSEPRYLHERRGTWGERRGYSYRR